MKMMRRAALANLVPDNGRMLELGVANGEGAIDFLRFLPGSAMYVGVDAWDGSNNHGEEEYEFAKQRIHNSNPYRKGMTTVIRQTFDNAYEIFNETCTRFDLIHIDGYAHLGNGGAENMMRWWYLVKEGGCLSIHDYCDDWPEQKKAIEELEERFKERGDWKYFHRFIAYDDLYDRYPTWCLVDGREE